LDAVQRVRERRVDLEDGFGCARKRLVGSVGRFAQGRADDADRTYQVHLRVAH
jgi:hypothetical protein